MAFTNDNILQSVTFSDLSDDGRFLSYMTTVNSLQTLYVRDLTTGATTSVASMMISHTNNADFGLQGGSLSADGHYVFYSTGALYGSLVVGNSQTHLLITDLHSDVATEVTPPYPTRYLPPGSAFPGAVASSLTLRPLDISADGRHVAFNLNYQDFSETDPAFEGNVFRDLNAATESRSSTGAQTTDAGLTPDGHYAYYSSYPFAYVVNLQTNTATYFGHVDQDPKTIDAIVSGGGLSDNGRYFAYGVSDGSGAGDPQSNSQVDLYDFSAKSNTVIAAGFFLALSGDGRHVAFTSAATNLVANDTDGVADLFVKDLDTGFVELVAPAAGVARVGISFDGSRLTYTSANGSGGTDNTDVHVVNFLPPTLSIASIADDNIVNGKEAMVPIKVHGTSDAIGQIVHVTSPTGASGVAKVASDGTWTALVYAKGLSDGAHTFTASVADGLGLRGTVSKSALFDATPPVNTLQSVAGDNIINFAEAPAAKISGMATDASGLPVTVTLAIDGNVFAHPVVQPDGKWSLSYDATGLYQGQHELEFSAIDAAGNTSARSIYFDVDTKAPAIAIKSIGGDNVVTSAEGKAGAPVTGTSDAIGSTVSVSIDGHVLGTGVVQANGTWIANIHTDGTVSGRTVVTASVADHAGNDALSSQTALFDSDIIRVSVKADGSEAEGDPNFNGGFYSSGLSADAHYVLFGGSPGTTLSPDATGSEVYLKDLRTGALTIYQGYDGQISGDGKYVVFVNSGGYEVVNLTTGVTTVANTTATGDPDNSYPMGTPRPDISADGKYVVFTSAGTNFVTGLPAQPSSDRVFVKNLDTGEVQLVSFVQPDTQLGFVPHSSIGGGRYVAFESSIAGTGSDTNNAIDIYLRDLQTGATSLVSAAPSGAAGNGNSLEPEISADGRYVAFYSYATNLVAGHTYSTPQAYLRDLQTGKTTLLSAAADGTPIGAFATDGNPNFAFTSDDRYVAFYTGVNGALSVTIKDLQTGALQSLSPASDLNTYNFNLTPDGRYASFSTNNANLVSNDTNGLNDVFIRRFAATAKLTLNPITGDDRITPAEAGAPILITGTSDVIGGTVTIAVEGVAMATATVAMDGTWQTTLDVSALPQTTLEFTATVLDAAGFATSDGSIVQIVPGASSPISIGVSDVVAGAVDPLHLKAGAVVTIQLNVGRPVTVSGGPTLSLNTGTATYDAAHSNLTAGLVAFVYTVAAGQNATSLQILHANTTSANAIKDATTHLAIDLTSVAGHDLGNEINTSAPPVLSVHRQDSGTGPLLAGQTAVIELDSSEPLKVSGTAAVLKLSDGGSATYDAALSDPANGKLAFDYTALAGQTTGSGNLKVTAVTIPAGGAITDLVGNAFNVASAANKDTGFAVNAVLPAVTVKLAHDTGVSATDRLTSDATVTGVADKGATISFAIDGDAAAGSATANATTGVFSFSPSGLSEGVHTLVASEINTAGNTSSAAVTFTVDTRSSTVQTVASSAAPGSILNAGKVLTVKLGFDEQLQVTGTPTLTLSDGEVATYNAAASNLATGLVAFTATVSAGHNTADLTVDHVNVPAGAAIRDLAGNVADVSAAHGSDLGITIDTTAPMVTGITAKVTPEKVEAGSDTLRITMATGETVTVAGNPTVKLSDGGVATFSTADSSSQSLVFVYHPRLGEMVDDLKISGLVYAAGSSIKDTAGNALSLAGIANADLHVGVDTLAPVLKLASVGSNPLYKGNDAHITLTTSENVTLDHAVSLQLSNGAIASYVSGDGGKTLVFDYVVGDEGTTDLKITGITAGHGGIDDAAGNALSVAADLKVATNVFKWTKITGGSFATAANWSPGSVPVAGNVALLTAAGTYTVTSDTAQSVDALGTAKTVTLAITDNVFAIAKGTAGASAGTIAVTGSVNGTILELGGAVINSGAITLNGAAGLAALELTGDLTLSGGGKLTLIDNPSGISNFVTSFNNATATLTNADNIISGAGTIGSGYVTLVNQAKGIINANSASHALALTSGVNVISNAGIIEATAGGTLTIVATDITQAATGLLSAVAAGSHIALDDATIIGGSVSSMKGAFIETAENHDSSIAAVKITNAGSIVAAHGDLTITGGVTNIGMLVADGHHLTVTGAVAGLGTGMVLGTGELELGSAATTSVAFDAAAAAAELVLHNSGNFTGKIAGFSVDDKIDLVDLNSASLQAATYSGTAAGGTLTLKDGTHTSKIAFTGNYAADLFHVGDDGHGGVEITLMGLTLSGDAGDNISIATVGADTISGGGHGAAGDTVSYAASAFGVTVDLNLATKQLGNGDARGDVLTDIQNLTGSAFADHITGDANANTLTGGAGADRLTGGGGADNFQFKSVLDGGDEITDFTQGTDHILISKSGFGIAATIAIDAANAAQDFGLHYLVNGASGTPTATETGHGQFLFNETTSQLFWDDDGKGAHAAKLVATLDSVHAALTAHDFALV